jgi:hypothetical protein
MAKYKARRNYVDHDFNNTTLTIDGEHKAEGLEMIEFELDEDENTIQKAADGVALINNNPSRSGTIKFQVLESSATTSIMWALRTANRAFKVSMLDTASPELDCKGAFCRIGKPPIVKRGLNGDVVEWLLICPYLDVLGGSYTLQTA